MDILIKNIEKKDFAKIQKFASDGMHFEMYTEKKIELYLYAKYFWYLELNQATQVLAAYDGNRLLGALLADMKGEPKVSNSIWRKLFIIVIEFFMDIIYGKSDEAYDNANHDMLTEFSEREEPDGELTFFAVDPKLDGKGIGSILLNEFAKRENGKLIYLFTNTGCSYHFYDKKGFTRSAFRKIEFALRGRKLHHDCYLYSKKL